MVERGGKVMKPMCCETKRREKRKEKERKERKAKKENEKREITNFAGSASLHFHMVCECIAEIFSRA